MDYRIEVYWRGQTDGRSVDLLSQIAHLGIDRVEQAQVSNLYFVRGTLAPEALNRHSLQRRDPDLHPRPDAAGFCASRRAERSGGHYPSAPA